MTDGSSDLDEVRASPDAHLLFDVGALRCAIPLARVRGVVRRPPIVPVPLSPGGLEGLGNLGGAVVAILGLRRVLGVERQDNGETARVILVEGGFPAGLVVDRMVGIADVAPERIERGEELDGSLPREHLAGLVRGDQGQPAILILDPDRVLRTALAPKPRSASGTGRLPGAVPAPMPLPEASERHLVSFDVDRQEYALPIDRVREIVRMPESLSRVPHARGHHLGLVSMRDRLVPIVSLQMLLGLPGMPLDQRARVVVAALDDGTTVGLVVEAVRDVLRVRDDLAEPVPAVFGQETGEDIEAICRLDGGKRLVCVLSAARLLRHDVIARAFDEEPMRQEPEEAEVSTDDQGAGPGVEQFVVFRLGRDNYGLPVQAVDEIIRVPEDLVQVPGAPSHVAGVMSRRGEVLSVLDQRRRFGLPEAPSGVRGHVIVANIGSVRAGLLVDAATGVIRIPADAIRPGPEFSGDHAQVVSRVANLAGGMILLLAPERLLSLDEIGDLADIAREAVDKNPE